QFLQQLKENGLYDNSVLVLYGDHDGGMQEDELATLKEVKNTPFNMVRLDKVPFLIHLPNSKKGHVLQNSGGTLDMTPTMLHLLGIQSKNKYFMGHDLFESHGDHL